MATTTQQTKRALRELDGAGKTIKSMLDEIRVQTHLAAMELDTKAGPYLREVSAVSRDAARDLVKRGRQLSSHMRRLRASTKSR